MLAQFPTLFCRVRRASSQQPSEMKTLRELCCLFLCFIRCCHLSSSAHVTQVRKSGPCKLEFFGATATFKSPHYPKGSQPPMRCEAVLEAADRNYVLRLDLADVYLNEGGDACGKSKLEAAETSNITGTSADADIALVKMDSDVEFSDYVRPAALGDPDFVKKEFFSKQDVHGVVSGWGKTEKTDHSKVLQEIRVPIKSPVICKASTELE
ncbi:hypothetical protein V5799_031161, partial [Amblyomma americanum]